jgi:hypothetical protein
MTLLSLFATVVGRTLWLGAAVFLNIFVGPEARSRLAADPGSELLGEITRKFHWLSYGCGALMLIGALGALPIESKRLNTIAFMACTGVAFALSLYAGTVIEPRIRSLRDMLEHTDWARPTSDVRDKFDHAHRVGSFGERLDGRDFGRRRARLERDDEPQPDAVRLRVGAAEFLRRGRRSVPRRRLSGGDARRAPASFSSSSSSSRSRCSWSLRASFPREIPLGGSLRRAPTSGPPTLRRRTPTPPDGRRHLRHSSRRHVLPRFPLRASGARGVVRSGRTSGAAAVREGGCLVRADGVARSRALTTFETALGGEHTVGVDGAFELPLAPGEWRLVVVHFPLLPAEPHLVEVWNTHTVVMADAVDLNDLGVIHLPEAVLRGTVRRADGGLIDVPPDGRLLRARVLFGSIRRRHGRLLGADFFVPADPEGRFALAWGRSVGPPPSGVVRASFGRAHAEQRDVRPGIPATFFSTSTRRLRASTSKPPCSSPRTAEPSGFGPTRGSDRSSFPWPNSALAPTATARSPRALRRSPSFASNGNGAIPKGAGVSPRVMCR